MLKKNLFVELMLLENSKSGVIYYLAIYDKLLKKIKDHTVFKIL